MKISNRGKGPGGWSGILLILFLLPLGLKGMSAAQGPPFYGVDVHKIQEAPKYLKICRRSDPTVDKCIKSSLEKLLESINSGSRADLPDIDPIRIPSVEFEQGSGNVSLHIHFKDFLIQGFKHFEIMSVKSNLMENKIEISMDCPYVLMAGQFSAEGGVFTFPIAGQGDFSMNLTEVSVLLILRLTTMNVLPGLSFFAVEDSLVDLLPDEITAHFGEFIDGSNKIGAAFNYFFNRNAHEIFTIIKPKVSEILANVFSAIANEILGRHPESVLLLP